MSKQKLFGPSAMVTAAFIGPGTLTVCTLAGVKFGYELVWVLVFATAATVILQGMAARLGIVTQSGLGEAMRSQIQNPILKGLSLGLVFVAIIVGNAAYEMGNVTGGVMGLEMEGFNHLLWGPLILGLLVAAILWTENYARIQTIMGILVVIMSLVFITSAILVGSVGELTAGLKPTLTNQNQLMALGLIGTTIVPYNLFLHASASANHWSNTAQLKSARREVLTTISLGGIISICVLVTASSGQGGIVQGVADMSRQLEPLLGSFAKPFLSIGIFAAGISSALTAPLAASLTAQGIFGWDQPWQKRIIWLSILMLGVLFSMMGFKPVSVIQVAQIANGILLPIVVIFLLIMSNKKQLMGKYVNSTVQNMLGAIVLLISLFISLRSFNSVFQFIG